MTELQTKSQASLAMQLRQSLAGEIVGTIVSVGAVYLARQVAPEQTERLTQLFAKILARHFNHTPEQAAQIAQKATDVTLMHLGGLGNMGTQMALRLRNPELRAKFGLKELGRVIVGRTAGTIGATGAIIGLETHAPDVLRATEQVMAKGIHLGQAPDARETRLASLILSSLMQSAGAIASNTPAQLLYDRVVTPGRERG